MLQICNTLKTLAPFLITLLLWRLSTPFWNPAGILALAPIFYYTFVKPIYWFSVFGVIICFLIDYLSGIPLFWTSLFCLTYALNGFQTIININHAEKNALFIFMTFIGIGIFLLTLFHINGILLLNNIWLFLLLSITYILVSIFSNRVRI
ncbi:MAG: hypothetical protein MJ156_00095 [Alphaproteobacteria bacterium]|nr:hypothetical protein [Alphaproteobacteria bacterium]